MGSLPPGCLLLLFHHWVPRMDQMLSFNLPPKKENLQQMLGKWIPSLFCSRSHLDIGMGGGLLCFLHSKQQGAVSLIRNLLLSSPLRCFYPEDCAFPLHLLHLSPLTIWHVMLTLIINYSWIQSPCKNVKRYSWHLLPSPFPPPELITMISLRLFSQNSFSCLYPQIENDGKCAILFLWFVLKNNLHKRFYAVVYSATCCVHSVE